MSLPPDEQNTMKISIHIFQAVRKRVLRTNVYTDSDSNLLCEIS